MKSINKKPLGTTGISQPFNRPAVHVRQIKPAVAQRKTAVPALSVKRPVAPPAYRPQAVPKVLQTKVSPFQNRHAGQAPRPPVAPAAYRPQPIPKVVQRKSHLPAHPAIPFKSGLPVASVSKPVPTAPVFQGQARVPVAQRKIAAPRLCGVIQRAVARCPTHDVELVDGECYQCVIDQSRVQQKPNQDKKKQEVFVTLDKWSEEYREVAAKLIKSLDSSSIVHRGNKAPKDKSNLVPVDLINHGESTAPVWFTVGESGTGKAIEGYKYHHVLTLKCKVAELIKANLNLTLNHSESVCGEASWKNYLVKSNEFGCFAVAIAKLPSFYSEFVTSHKVIEKKGS